MAAKTPIGSCERRSGAEEEREQAAAGEQEPGQRAGEAEGAGEHRHAEDGEADQAAEGRRREVRDAGAAELAVGVDLAAGGDLEAGGVEQAAERAPCR